MPRTWRGCRATMSGGQFQMILIARALVAVRASSCWTSRYSDFRESADRPRLLSAREAIGPRHHEHPLPRSRPAGRGPGELFSSTHEAVVGSAHPHARGSLHAVFGVDVAIGSLPSRGGRT